MARKTELGRLENVTHVFRFHRLPTAVDSVHVALVAHLQQSAHHQVHVVLDVSRLLDALTTNGGHHAVLQSGAAKSVPLLVRVVAFGK